MAAKPKPKAKSSRVMRAAGVMKRPAAEAKTKVRARIMQKPAAAKGSRASVKLKPKSPRRALSSSRAEPKSSRTVRASSRAERSEPKLPRTPRARPRAEPKSPRTPRVSSRAEPKSPRSPRSPTVEPKSPRTAKSKSKGPKSPLDISSPRGWRPKSMKANVKEPPSSPRSPKTSKSAQSPKSPRRPKVVTTPPVQQAPSERRVTFLDKVIINEYHRKLGGGDAVPTDGSWQSLGLSSQRVREPYFEPIKLHDQVEDLPRKYKKENGVERIGGGEELTPDDRLQILRDAPGPDGQPMAADEFDALAARERSAVEKIFRQRGATNRSSKDFEFMPESIEQAQQRADQLRQEVLALQADMHRRPGAQSCAKVARRPATAAALPPRQQKRGA